MRFGAAEGTEERILALRTEQLRREIQCREVSEEVRVIWKLLGNDMSTEQQNGL